MPETAAFNELSKAIDRLYATVDSGFTQVNNRLDNIEKRGIETVATIAANSVRIDVLENVRVETSKASLPRLGFVMGAVAGATEGLHWVVVKMAEWMK